jgi:hypothetical protein
LSYLII